MYKLRKLQDVDKSARLKHDIALAIEFLMSIVSIGVLIYYVCIGDPNKRILPTLGSVFVFLIPVVIELIFKKRFSFYAHIIFTIYVTLAVFIGCAFNMHNFDNPYDEILHFIFGYVSCVFFFYFLIAWKDYGKQSVTFNAVLIFLLGMSIAPLWEVLEFSVDVLIGQTSLGIPTEEFMEEAKALGYSGIGLYVYKLEYGVSVWDTITDMTLHTGGSLLFTIQYIIYRKCNTHLMLYALEKDYMVNREKFYERIDEDVKDEITTEVSES